MSKSMLVSFWANYSRCEIGAEWNFIPGYWDISFTFLFWTIDFSKLVEPSEGKTKNKKDTKNEIQNKGKR